MSFLTTIAGRHVICAVLGAGVATVTPPAIHHIHRLIHPHVVSAIPARPAPVVCAPVGGATQSQRLVPNELLTPYETPHLESFNVTPVTPVAAGNIYPLQFGGYPLVVPADNVTLFSPVFPTVNVTPTPVSRAPEPETWVLFVVGFGLIGVFARRSRTINKAFT